MSNKIKLKRGLSSKINSVVLDDGEVALTTDTNKLYSKKGEIAPNNVYVGTSEPSNNNIECWINPNASFDPTAYFDRIYPVGSLYMSVSSTDPSELFGGTWTKIEGSFLWATTSTPKVTGGSKTTDSTVLTIDQIPKHSHYVQSYRGSAQWDVGYLWSRAAGESDGNAEGGQNNDTGNTGGGKGHTHTFMPPYFEVYMWYRIK
jgi:hypothetical protein